MRHTVVTALTVALTWPAASVADTTKPVIDEWLVPYENSRPRDPYVAPDGSVWFCGQAGGYVARFDPGSESFEKHDLDDGAGPHNLIVDDEGTIWFAANTLPYIGELDPATGQVKKHDMPDPSAKDPHTLVFDDRGHIWFTAQWGNAVGRLDMDSGKIDLVEIPIDRARPYGIKVAPDGRPWIALLGTFHLATVNPTDMTLETVALPRDEARPRRLEVTGDGAVWYGDYAAGFLGRYDPSSGTFEEWQMPGGKDARPYGTALDDAGVLWVADGGVPNRLVAFDTQTRSVLSVTDIPKARGSVRHMFYDSARGDIWFGEDTNYLARARRP